MHQNMNQNDTIMKTKNIILTAISLPFFLIIFGFSKEKKIAVNSSISMDDTSKIIKEDILPLVN